MRRALIGAACLTLVGGLALSTTTPATAGSVATATANTSPASSSAGDTASSDTGGTADLADPLAAKQSELRQEAVQAVIKGTAKVESRSGSQVVKVGTKSVPLTAAQKAQAKAGQTVTPKKVDQYVELSREKTDKIFVVLAEFGNTRATDIDPRYGDVDTDPATAGPTTFQGPRRNQITEPDRTKDNSTIWQKYYSPEHYRQLYFGAGSGVESLKTYYEKQSSGRYSVDGTVTDWVKVKYNEARYGRSNGFPCTGIVCSNTWNLLKDALDQWVLDQKATGRTDAQIKTDLTSFDQWDRYDYDGDGNFNEPDGYIDHFQVVHAGGDQADGDPQQGEDAIWSHRWRAFQSGEQGPGPANFPIGGTQIGTTGLWVADYTVQPENGGLSVFAHEYGHDLGLPDHYDTAGGGDTAVNWWTLMAQSRARAKGDEGIGTRPADLGVWDKLQLGWLDYEVVLAGQQKTIDLGPHEYNSAKAQGVVVVLPKKQVTSTLPTPPEGTKQWWSGKGDDLNTSLTRQVVVPAGTSQLTFKASWDIEDCGADACDYAYVEVDNGSGWKAIPGSITTAAEGNGIDGTSAGYQPATFDMSAYAGSTVGLRFRYATDGAAGGTGFFADDIALTAGTTTVFTDGAEAGANGWTATGFTAVGAVQSTAFDQYYLASNRSRVSYDRYLQYGPYNFGFGTAAPDKVEFFPYQEGLLVNYWDTSYSDNNTTQHPGAGLVLPVDAHPDLLANLTGAFWRGRIQTYDAPFSLRKAESFTLHVNGQPSYVRGQAAQPVFDDTTSYWRAEQPFTGVKVAGAGVTMTVVKQQGTSMTVKVGTSPTT